MAVTIINHQIRSADMGHAAEPGSGGWTVPWFPGRGLTQVRAAVMKTAGAAGQIPADCWPAAGYGVVAAAGPGGDEDEQA